MVSWVSGLPDQKHIPYPFIAAEPHAKIVSGMFRVSDYITLFSVGLGFPLGLYLVERRWPSVHPKRVPMIIGIQVPFFMGCVKR